MKKISKGSFGYTKSHRKWEIIKLCVYMAIALSVFLLGLLVTKTTKNLMTVVAVVGALPVSKAAVSVIMAYKRKPMDSKIYEEISSKAGDLEQAYELLFTTAETFYSVEAIIIEGKDVIDYTVDPKCDVSKLQAHLQKMLAANDYPINVKIFKDYKKFMDRAGDLNRREKSELPYKQHPTYPDLNRDQLVKHVLLALSI